MGLGAGEHADRSPRRSPPRNANTKNKSELWDISVHNANR